MPAAIHLSHRLVEQQAKVRKKKNSPLPWLRPDAKSQVTLRYENGKATAIDAVVLSTQHDPSVKQKDLVEAVRTHIIDPVLPKKWIHKGTKFHINPTGKFVIGGPVGDCGLTGRKIIVDTYGGWARHGLGRQHHRPGAERLRDRQLQSRRLPVGTTSKDESETGRIAARFLLRVRNSRAR